MVLTQVAIAVAATVAVAVFVVNTAGRAPSFAQ